MINGDIGNSVSQIHVFFDGNHLVYYELEGWWYRLQRWFAYRLRNRNWMMHLIKIEQLSIRIVMNLHQNAMCVVRVMGFTPRESWILDHCIFGQIGYDYLVVDIWNPQDFQDVMEVAAIMVSNQYMKTNAAGRRITFRNVNEVKLAISQEIGFKGVRR